MSSPRRSNLSPHALFVERQRVYNTRGSNATDLSSENRLVQLSFHTYNRYIYRAPRRPFFGVRTVSLLGEKGEETVFSRPLRALTRGVRSYLDTYFSLTRRLGPPSKGVARRASDANGKCFATGSVGTSNTTPKIATLTQHTRL